MAEVSTFPWVRLTRASLWEPVQRRCGRNRPVRGASLRALFSGFRFAVPETGSTSSETGHRNETQKVCATILSAAKGSYCRPTLCSCSAQEYGKARARPVTVTAAGAVPSTIAEMIRGDTKARGANRRICRSPWPSCFAMSLNDAIRPCRRSLIHRLALAMAPSRASRLSDLSVGLAAEGE